MRCAPSFLRLGWGLWLAAVGYSTPLFGFTVVYSANRQGEIDPCDCSTGQAGGLARWVGAVRAVAGPKIVVDAGDAFFTRIEARKEKRPAERRRGQLIAEGYRRAGVDAWMPGERDLGVGSEAFDAIRQAAGAKVVACNLSTIKGEAIGEPTAIFERGGKRIGITGIADPAAYVGVDWVRVAPAADALKTCVEKLRAQNADYVFVLSHAGLPLDRELAAAVKVDAIFGSHSIDSLAPPEKVGETSIFQPDFRGRQLGTATFPEGGASLVDLLDDAVLDPPTKTAVDAYKRTTREVAETDAAATAPAAEHPNRYVANASTCRKCHEVQTQFWETTKHAAAYLVLYAKNQHFDPECIACHSVGFEKPEGFLKIARPIEWAEPKKTQSKVWAETLMQLVFEKNPKPLDSRKEPQRFEKLRQKYLRQVHAWEAKPDFRHLFIGVQCEHCHGNRHGHPVTSVPKTQISPALCTQCHQPPNDTHFDYAAMLPRVSCPKSNDQPRVK